MVVDCGQALVSYTKDVREEPPLTGCGLRTGFGELHWPEEEIIAALVVDCGQALVSYTSRSLTLPSIRVVDCGQALVSYTGKARRLASSIVVDCGQALVSYTRDIGCALAV